MEKSAFRKGMETTTWILAGATVLLVAVFWISGASWILSAAISIGTTLYHFAMRLAVGFFIPLCIKKYDCQNWWFRPRKWETVFYRKLQVKKWKKHLPTFDPKKFSTEIYTLPQIVQNMCEAEIVHEIIVVFSFLPLAAVPVFGEFPVFLITSLVAGLFDCVFIIAQRYNRPRIIRLMQKGAKGP